MGLNIGIVGLPNAGKSTIFNALTASQVPAEAFPFCTIDPSTGVVPVPDARLERITALYKPEKVTPTIVEFVDIAGLVKNASQGEGLGNKFLSHIREVDAIAHVVRCFEDPNVTHVYGKIDPREDIEIINTELILADLDAVNKRLDKEKKVSRSNDKRLLANVALLEQLKETLDSGKPARIIVPEKEEDKKYLKELFLLTSKPILYVANTDEQHSHSERLEAVRKIAAEEKTDCVELCGKLEAEIAQLSAEEKKEFLKEMGLTEPGLNRLSRAGYHILNLITFFTAGPKEVHAWTVHRGAKAPQAAGVIHTDFEKGFIRAETFSFADLDKLESEAAIKSAGKYRSEGKEYLVQDGDMMLFRFNV